MGHLITLLIVKLLKQQIALALIGFNKLNNLQVAGLTQRFFPNFLATLAQACVNNDNGIVWLFGNILSGKFTRFVSLFHIHMLSPLD
jgi:hypothetical protein